LYKAAGAVCERVHQAALDLIPVLIQKAGHLVVHLARVVKQSETGAQLARHREEVALTQCGHELTTKTLISCAWESRLFIEHIHNAETSLDHVQGLNVVGELDRLPLNALLLVDLLLQLEHVVVEELL